MTRDSNGTQQPGWFAVAWIALVLAAYYSRRVPFEAHAARRWLELAADVGATAALLASAAGVGLLILQPLHLQRVRGGAEIALGFLLGAWLLSAWWLGIGILGGLTRTVALVSTAAWLLISIAPLRRWWIGVSSIKPGGHILLMLFVGATVSISLLAALLPPIAFDAFLYHLFLPEEWIVAGRLTTWQLFPHAYFPHLLETLFLPAMLLGSDIAATLVHWSFLPIVLLLLGDITSRFLPAGSAWYTVAFAVATPIVPLLASTPYTDTTLAAASIGAVWAFLNWSRDPNLRWIAVSGSLAGMAMALKYTSFVLPISIAVLIMWCARHRPSEATRALVVFAALAVIAASPWYLYTFWRTGNPVYPFVFGGPEWDPFRAAYYAGAGTGIGADVVEWVLLPLWSTLGIGDANGWDSNFGPLYLALLPLAIHACGRRSVVPKDQLLIMGMLAFVAAMHIAAWATAVSLTAHLRQNRFLLTPLLMLTPCLSVAIAGSLSARVRRSGEVVAVAAVAVVFLTAWLGQAMDFARSHPELWLLGLESRDRYYARTLPSYAAAMAATGSLPSNAKLFLLWEPRAYLSRRPSHPDAIMDEFEYRLRVCGSPQSVADWWRRQGYTHLLVAWDNRQLSLDRRKHLAQQGRSKGVPRVPIRELSTAFDQLLETETNELWASTNREYVIYVLRPAASVASERESCTG